MPCYQSANFPSGFTTTGRTGYATEADCLNACKEGACCEGTSCSIKARCQCQGTGQTFKGVGTTCAGCPCGCPANIRFEVSQILTDYLRVQRGQNYRLIGNFNPTVQNSCESGGFIGFLAGAVYLKCDSTGFWVEVTAVYELCSFQGCTKTYKSGYVRLQTATGCTTPVGVCGVNGYPAPQTLTQADFSLVSDNCPLIENSPCNGQSLTGDNQFNPYTANTFPQWISINLSTNPLP
jgi:hypothetical protein